MRRLFLFLIFLIASVWMGVALLRHPGFLFIVYQPWMVQMPLWFALIATFIIFGLFYFLITGIDGLYFLWFRLKSWLRFRREHRAYSKTQYGLASLIEGRWKKAERLLLAGVNQTIDPLMNYLGAAKAAHELGAFERRDKYFQTAYHVAPRADLAIGLMQAHMELQQDQLEHASATLHHLRTVSPRHPEVLRMLEKVYVRSSDWNNLLALMPAMRKAGLLNNTQYEQFEKNIYCQRFEAANREDLSGLHELWNKLPRSARKNPEIVCAYVKQLQRIGHTSLEVEDLIRVTLKSQWHAELATIYGNLPFNNLNRQLVIVGAWLKQYGSQPELLLILGKLCVRIQLWGKAKDYFKRCMAEGPNPVCALEYGQLLEQLGEADAAMEVYKTGLKS